MGYQNKYQPEKKINPETLVEKAMNNVMDYDFAVATSNDATMIAHYPDKFAWLVNTAESACKGAGLITTRSTMIDFENLTVEEEGFLDAARKLLTARYSKDPSTIEANVERAARGLLEEVVSGPYDSKRNKKEMELQQMIIDKTIDKEKASLELARYRFQLLIEAAEAKKTIRKEMNQ